VPLKLTTVVTILGMSVSTSSSHILKLTRQFYETYPLRIA